MENNLNKNDEYGFNCRYFKAAFRNMKHTIDNLIKTTGSYCMNCSKGVNLCSFFSCGLSEKDFFVDLEEGRINGNGVDKNKMSNNNVVSGGKENEPICAKCYLKKADVVILPCGHGNYCNDCLEEWSEKSINCPTCGVQMTDVVQCI